MAALCAHFAPDAAALQRSSRRARPRLLGGTNEANDADDDNLSPIQRMRKQYEEKPEESGGWSIFAAGSPWAGEDSTPKPDPPWLAAAKKRSDERAASSAGKAWNESPYASESKPQSGIDMDGMKAQYQKPRWADIFGMGGGGQEELHCCATAGRRGQRQRR